MGCLASTLVFGSPQANPMWAVEYAKQQQRLNDDPEFKQLLQQIIQDDPECKRLFEKQTSAHQKYLAAKQAHDKAGEAKAQHEMMEIQKNPKFLKLLMPHKYTNAHRAGGIHYGGNTTTTTTGTFANNNFTPAVPVATAYPVYTAGTTDPPSMFSTIAAGTGESVEGGCSSYG